MGIRVTRQFVPDSGIKNFCTRQANSAIPTILSIAKSIQGLEKASDLNEHVCQWQRLMSAGYLAHLQHPSAMVDMVTFVIRHNRGTKDSIKVHSTTGKGELLSIIHMALSPQSMLSCWCGFWSASSSSPAMIGMISRFKWHACFLCVVVHAAVVAVHCYACGELWHCCIAVLVQSRIACPAIYHRHIGDTLVLFVLPFPVNVPLKGSITTLYLVKSGLLRRYQCDIMHHAWTRIQYSRWLLIHH